MSLRRFRSSSVQQVLNSCIASRLCDNLSLPAFQKEYSKAVRSLMMRAASNLTGRCTKEFKRELLMDRLLKYTIAAVFIFISLSSHSILLARPRQSKAAAPSETSPSDPKAAVIFSAKQYRASLERLIELLDAEVKRKDERLQKLTKLYNDGLISRRDLQQAQHEVIEAKAKVQGAQARIVEVDTLIAETIASETDRGQIGDGSYTVAGTVIRYNGTARWALSEAVKLSTFFETRFGRALPISAYGQTETHNRMGLDHSEGLDIAVHPDSSEGKAILDYLRSMGLPFIAFRSAIPGSATGAHIHVGNPSNRLSK